MEEEKEMQQNIYLDCRSQRSTGLDSIQRFTSFHLPSLDKWRESTDSSPTPRVHGCLCACVMATSVCVYVREKPLPLKLPGTRVEERYASVCVGGHLFVCVCEIQ